MPNVSGIGLDHTTLTLDAKGMPSFDPATIPRIATVLGFAAVGAMAGLVLAALVYGVLARPGRR